MYTLGDKAERLEALIITVAAMEKFCRKAENEGVLRMDKGLALIPKDIQQMLYWVQDDLRVVIKRLNAVLDKSRSVLGDLHAGSQRARR